MRTVALAEASFVQPPLLRPPSHPGHHRQQLLDRCLLLGRNRHRLLVPNHPPRGLPLPRREPRSPPRSHQPRDVVGLVSPHVSLLVVVVQQIGSSVFALESSASSPSGILVVSHRPISLGKPASAWTGDHLDHFQEQVHVGVVHHIAVQAPSRSPRSW